ncbi:MAG: sensor histidine kinase [Akkermansiaceae bacterium]
MNWRNTQNSATWVWIAFACCACLVIGAMSWLTRSVIQTENDRALAEIRAELQERVRLSLWRMDSLAASILLEENSIPPHLFLTEPKSTLPAIVRFETPDGAAIKGIGDNDELTKISQILPSLVSAPSAFSEIKENSSKSLNSNELDPINKAILDDRLNPIRDTSASPSTVATQKAIAPQSKIRGGEQAQNDANSLEASTRNRWLEQAIIKQKRSYSNYGIQAENAGAPSAPDQETKKEFQPTPSAIETNDPVSEFKPLWFEDSLFLLRKGMTRHSFAQGSLIDHERLKQKILLEALPLLPQAKLKQPDQNLDHSLILASFPLQLSPGNIGVAPDSIPRSISITLLAGWLAALAAILTAFFLILNVMKLSERRASFVSAVTHELRTPLTTFRLYSDMLSNGAVIEEKRPLYLNVLSREADRLSHLVENVLAFSQIERGSARTKVTEIEINEFLAQMRERFESRLDAAGLSLKMKEADSFRCTLDTSALEHILFNLIDNAAKYAADSKPAIVELDVSRKPKGIEIRVSDYGPGIPQSESRRIFRSFHKSAEQAAETKPGIGLGLALSKRLATSMGGSLACDQRTDGSTGAIFVLNLPCQES